MLAYQPDLETSTGVNWSAKQPILPMSGNTRESSSLMKVKNENWLSGYSTHWTDVKLLLEPLNNLWKSCLLHTWFSRVRGSPIRFQGAFSSSPSPRHRADHKKTLFCEEPFYCSVGDQSDFPTHETSLEFPTLKYFWESIDKKKVDFHWHSVH